MDEGFLRVLALLRIVIGLHLLYVALSLGSRVWFVESAPASVWLPVSLAALIPSSVPIAFAHVLFLVSIVGIVMVVIGLLTPIMGGVTFAAIVVLGSMVHSFGKINHGHHILILLLFILGSSPWGARWSLDAWIRRTRGRLPSAPASLWPQWPLKMAMLMVGLLYATSGAWKLHIGGFLEPGTMAQFMAGRAARMEGAGTPIVGLWGAINSFIIAHPGFGDVLSYLTVVLELGIIFGILTKRLGVMALGMVAILHASIALLSGLSFVHNMIVALVLATAFILLIAREGDDMTAKWFPDRVPAGDRSGAKAHTVFIMSATAAAVTMLIAAWLPIWGWSVPRDPWGSALLASLLPTLGNNAVFVSGLLLGTALVTSMGASVGVRVVRIAKRDLSGTPPLVFLYDQDCGSCQRWVDWAKKRGPVAVDFAPCQGRPELLKEQALDQANCMERVYLIPTRPPKKAQPGRPREEGTSAILGVLARFPGHRNVVWRLLGSARHMTGVHGLLETGYSMIARNRHHVRRAGRAHTTT